MKIEVFISHFEFLRFGKAKGYWINLNIPCMKCVSGFWGPIDGRMEIGILSESYEAIHDSLGDFKRKYVFGWDFGQGVN